MAAPKGSVVLSTLEFDVLWQAERLPERHVALETASPGQTHSERAELEEQAWQSLAERGLTNRGRLSGEMLDKLSLLARPQLALDVWVWADREISALVASGGGDALLAMVDGPEVWLIPARASALAEAAVTVIGDSPPGSGRSVSLPHEALRRADTAAGGQPQAMVTALEDRGVGLAQAQELARMLVGQLGRGQFGVQRTSRDGQVHRADRVVAFYDNDTGRYLMQLGRNADGRDWATVAPADNGLLIQRIRELIDEV